MSIDAKKRAQAVVLELVTRSRNNEFVGKTRLYKAFYFAHLYFAQAEDGYLTEWPIVRMPNGPGIGDFGDLIGDLVESGNLTVEETTCDGPFPESRYRSDAEPDSSVLPKGAIDAIDKTLKFIDDKSAGLLSSETHEYSRSWKEGKNGDALNIYIDLMDDGHYENRLQRAQLNEKAFRSVFG